jgi:hypothetical protein
MMIAGLWLQYPDRVTEEDRRRFLAALAQLPTGHGSKPSLLVDRITEGRPEGQPAFRLIFVDGGMWHHSVRRFDTEGDTMQYGAQFLLTLRLEGRV